MQAIGTLARTKVCTVLSLHLPAPSRRDEAVMTGSLEYQVVDGCPNGYQNSLLCVKTVSNLRSYS